MKKTFCIFLLFCLVAPVICSSAYVQVQRYRLRKKVKHHIMLHTKLSDWACLTLKNSEIDQVLKWEHDKEFEYQGEMYDVVKKESRNDSTTYWCWWDQEETALNRQLRKLLSIQTSEDPENKKRSNRLYRLLESIFTFEETASLHKPPQLIRTKNDPGVWWSESYSINPPSPPPKVVAFS